MSILVDRTICPDCRGPLDTAGTCLSCGLRLVGPLAVRLYDTLGVADGLVTALRAERVVAPAAADLPIYPVPGARPVSAGRRRRRLAAPGVLLGLGALCLLVAATIFITIAWSALGLGARTTILLGITGLLAAAAVMVTRRDLRLAAETGWSLVALMTALDLVAGRIAHLYGVAELPWGQLIPAIGGTWLVLGLAVSLWTTRAGLRVPQSCPVLVTGGAVVVVWFEAWTASRPIPVTAVSIGLLAALAAVLRDRARPSAYGVAGVAVLSWLVLFGQSLGALSSAAGAADWWQHASGWPFLALAGYAAAGSRMPLPEPARIVAALAALVSLGLVVVGPGESADLGLLTAAALLAAAAAVSGLADRIWSRAAGVLTAAGLLGFGATMLVRPLVLLDALPATSTRHDAATLPLPPANIPLAAWTAVLVPFVAVVAAAGLLRHLPPQQAPAGRQTALSMAPALLGVGGLTLLLESQPVLWLAVAGCLAVLAVAVASAYVGRRTDAALAGTLLLTSYLVVMASALAGPSRLLSAITATAVAAVAGLAITFGRRELLAGLALPVFAVVAALLSGWATHSWADVAGADRETRALLVAGCAGLLAIVAGEVRRGPATRLCLELGAVVVGCMSIELPLPDGIVAMQLTMLGSAACLVALLHRDRAQVAWLGAVVLGAATVLRVAAHVSSPELYTLPAALLLLVTGVVRLSAAPGSSSWKPLGSGLTLALAPSLLLALDEPVSVRGVLIAAAGLLCLAIGARCHWAAPFTAGALTTGMLALRHLGPVAEAVPRWISLGAVGVLLLAVGVTWESRRRTLAAASDYLTALR